MSLGVTTKSVLALTLPKEVNRVGAGNYISFCELAVREQQNRPQNEDRIRGIPDAV